MKSSLLLTLALALALASPAAAQILAGGGGGTPTPILQGPSATPIAPTVSVTLIDSATGECYVLSDVISTLVRATTHRGTTPVEWELVIVKLGDDSDIVNVLKGDIAQGDPVSAALTFTTSSGATATLQARNFTDIVQKLRHAEDDGDGDDLDDFQQESLKITFSNLAAGGGTPTD